MPLGAIAEDRDGLAVELAQVGVLVVEDVVGSHGRAGYRSALRISLPEGVRGSAAASSTRFGTLNPASDSPQWRRRSSGVTCRAALEHDHCGHRLLPLRVLATDHRGVGDLGVAQQHLLDLGRDDVLAAADDQVVDPVLDVEEALVVDVAEVAGVQPAVGVGPARSHGRALDQDLAVEDAQVGRQQRPTGGAELAAGVGREPGSSPANRSRSDRRSGRPSHPGRSPPAATPPGPGRRRPGSPAEPERSAPASSSRVSIVVTTETTVIPSPSSAAATRSTSKPSWRTAVVP